MVKKTARCPRCGEVDSAKLKTIEKLSKENKNLKISKRHQISKSIRNETIRYVMRYVRKEKYKKNLLVFGILEKNGKKILK